MSSRARMSFEELKRGLSAGRTLIQEEWANPNEKADCDKLISEGFAKATDWEYMDSFQCERRIIHGIKQ